MAANGQSGQYGDARIGASPISEIKGWTFNPKVSTPQYASNKTQGFKRTVAGIRSADGTLKMVWDSQNPPANSGVFGVTQATFNIGVGANIALNLYLPNMTPATGMAIAVPSAIIGSLSYNVDIDSGDIVTVDPAYVVNGGWNEVTASSLLMDDGPDGGAALTAPPDVVQAVSQAAAEQPVEQSVSMEEKVAIISARALEIMRAKRAHELRAMRINNERTVNVDLGERLAA